MAPNTKEEWLEITWQEAAAIAKESNRNCYVLHSPMYAASHHEYDENREHLSGTQAGIDILCKRYDWMTKEDWNLVGYVIPDGTRLTIG